MLIYKPALEYSVFMYSTSNVLLNNSGTQPPGRGAIGTGPHRKNK